MHEQLGNLHSRRAQRDAEQQDPANFQLFGGAETFATAAVGSGWNRNQAPDPL